MPIVIVVGTVVTLFFMLGEIDDGERWRKHARVIAMTATCVIAGMLGLQAGRLKLKSYRAYKRELDLAEFRRRKGL